LGGPLLFAVFWRIFLFDYHVHTPLCGHATGRLEEYVQRAIELGLEELGFSGHYPYPPSFKPPVDNCVIPQQRFGEYLSEVSHLRELYSDRIKIRAGAEFDYLGPGRSFHPLETARELGLDFCIASVHIVDGVVVDYTPELLRSQLDRFQGGIDGVYQRYYEALGEIAAGGYCCILGHFDLVKKFNTLPGLAPGGDHSRLVERVLDLIADSGMVLEINTSGWDKPCQEQYPSLEILRRAVARGIGLTVGSDAHSPREVGRHFDRLADVLESLGVNQLVRFEKLEALPYDLN